MWAVESGNVGPEVRDDIIDYQCAEAFGWSPEVTATQGAEKIETLLFIHQAVKNKERKESENITRSGTNGRRV
jgi:hypothetical protein